MSDQIKKATSNSLGVTKQIKVSVPIYKKYAKESSMTWIDPSSRLKPSDLSKPALDIIADDYPLIIEFNNIKDNTSQIHSSVDIDLPLFQPSPKIVLFEEYTPFAIQEKKLFFRNNDAVGGIHIYKYKSFSTLCKYQYFTFCLFIKFVFRLREELN